MPAVGCGEGSMHADNDPLNKEDPLGLGPEDLAFGLAFPAERPTPSIPETPSYAFVGPGAVGAGTAAGTGTGAAAAVGAGAIAVGIPIDFKLTLDHYEDKFEQEGMEYLVGLSADYVAQGRRPKEEQVIYRVWAARQSGAPLGPPSMLSGSSEFSGV